MGRLRTATATTRGRLRWDSPRMSSTQRFTTARTCAQRSPSGLIMLEADVDFLLLDPAHEEETYTASLAYCLLDGPLFTIRYTEIRELIGGFSYNTAIMMPAIAQVVSFPFLRVPPSDGTKGAQAAPHGQWLWNPAVTLGIFGVAAAEMPMGSAVKTRFARLQLALAATVDVNAGILSIDGQLTPASFVLDPHCHLTGVGGYHLRFKAPTQCPSPPRLGISWSFSDAINITGEAYFAITPKVCMGGGRLHVTLSVGPLSAYFDAYIDFLIQYRPFNFETQGGLAVGVRYTLDLWLVSIPIAVDIGATLFLEGPPVAGRVHVDFWVFGFDIKFGALAIRPASFIDLTEFYNLVLQADTTPPALLPGITVDAPPVPWLLSCTSGLIPTPSAGPTGITPRPRTVPGPYVAPSLPLRSHATRSLSQLWGKYQASEDLLDGRSSPTVTLNTHVHLQAPVEQLSIDQIADFSAEKTMGQVAAQTPFPARTTANGRWYAADPAPSAAEQFCNVVGAWELLELGASAAQQAVWQWAALLGRGAIQLKADPPQQLMGRWLSEAYTEAPRLTAVC
ncbi:uncharacterized protein CDV56_102574 [Aspergillus thermomutatus]|uniref:DUF6603 domain-containing protein n=1 Tax=Aspergillus thermomutatus TaxID=41047 RepID=A0A397GAD6_ASPTH|nr:uncharacterized protein CDV56_102574 [Aspergillus thermomutatus]RHZ47019.1 hypothetical protein CDV56_102574 [Aspergillus thermomutatus]